MHHAAAAADDDRVFSASRLIYSPDQKGERRRRRRKGADKCWPICLMPRSFVRSLAGEIGTTPTDRHDWMMLYKRKKERGRAESERDRIDSQFCVQKVVLRGTEPVLFSSASFVLGFNPT